MMPSWMVFSLLMLASGKAGGAGDDDSDGDSDGPGWVVGLALGVLGGVCIALGLALLFKVKDARKQTRDLLLSGKQTIATIKRKDMAEDVIFSEAKVEGCVASFSYTAERDGKDCALEVEHMKIPEPVWKELLVGAEVPCLYSEHDIRVCVLEAAAHQTELPGAKLFWGGLLVVLSAALVVVSIVLPSGGAAVDKFVGVIVWAALSLVLSPLVVTICRKSCGEKHDNVKVLDEVPRFMEYGIFHPVGQKIGLGFEDKDGLCVVSRINNEEMNEKRSRPIEIGDLLHSVNGKPGTHTQLLDALKAQTAQALNLEAKEVQLEFRRPLSAADYSLPDLLKSPKRIEWENSIKGTIGAADVTFA
jgi:hypothetical protein